MPPTDKTLFDDWLKARLYRDLIFRFVLVAVITAAATYFAVIRRGIPSTKYFAQMTESLAPLINTIGSVSLVLYILALMFKDLEAKWPSSFGQSSWIGKSGSVVRRLAGDISLWTFGALAAVVVSASTATVSLATSLDKTLILLLPYGFTIFILVGTGLINFSVRRGAATPWHTKLSSAILFYLAALLAFAYFA